MSSHIGVSWVSRHHRFFIRLLIAIFSDVSRARSYAEMENQPDDEPTVSTAAPRATHELCAKVGDGVKG